MHGRNSYEDELARRRRLRERQAADGEESEGEGSDEETPHFGWKDILAMCIAAYQIIFPILLALIGAMILAYLLFKWVFAS